MGSRLGIERLFRWSRPRQPEPPDAAEVGTAFGMELSLQSDAADAAERKADEAPASAEGPQVTSAERAKRRP